jgi:hypothetical protein
MGTLLSIVIDDDFSLFLFRFALTHGGWSVADFARLGCASTPRTDLGQDADCAR